MTDMETYYFQQSSNCCVTSCKYEKKQGMCNTLGVLHDLRVITHTVFYTLYNKLTVHAVVLIIKQQLFIFVTMKAFYSNSARYDSCSMIWHHQSLATTNTALNLQHNYI